VCDVCVGVLVVRGVCWRVLLCVVCVVCVCAMCAMCVVCVGVRCCT
jgi:hypothetical protein